MRKVYENKMHDALKYLT